MKKENFILLLFLISLLVQSQSLTNVQEIIRSQGNNYIKKDVVE
jgi:hypothetical protein